MMSKDVETSTAVQQITDLLRRVMSREMTVAEFKSKVIEVLALE
jgi:hypothetical protein